MDTTQMTLGLGIIMFFIGYTIGVIVTEEKMVKEFGEYERYKERQSVKRRMTMYNCENCCHYLGDGNGCGLALMMPPPRFHDGECDHWEDFPMKDFNV